MGFKTPLYLNTICKKRANIDIVEPGRSKPMNEPSHVRSDLL